MQQKQPKKGQSVRVSINGALAPCTGKVVAVQGNWAYVAFTGPNGPYVTRFNWRSGTPAGLG